MAGSREIALGVASALGFEHAANPFPLSFKSQTLEEAGTIVLAILAECSDAGIELNRVEMDPELCREVQTRANIAVPIEADEDLQGGVRFYKE